MQLVYCVILVTNKCHLRNYSIMNTKKILKKQGLMPKNSQAHEMQIFGFFSLWFVLAAVIYFS